MLIVILCISIIFNWNIFSFVVYQKKFKNTMIFRPKILDKFLKCLYVESTNQHFLLIFLLGTDWHVGVFVCIYICAHTYIRTYVHTYWHIYWQTDIRTYEFVKQYKHPSFWRFHAARIPLHVNTMYQNILCACASRESNPGPNDGNVGFYH